MMRDSYFALPLCLLLSSLLLTGCWSSNELREMDPQIIAQASSVPRPQFPSKSNGPVAQSPLSENPLTNSKVISRIEREDMVHSSLNEKPTLGPGATPSNAPQSALEFSDDPSVGEAEQAHQVAREAYRPRDALPGETLGDVEQMDKLPQHIAPQDSQPKVNQPAPHAEILAPALHTTPAPSGAVTPPNGWYVQIAADREQVDANDRRKSLIAHGQDAYVQRAVVNGDIFYRVLAGPFHSRPIAQTHLNKIEALGIGSVPPFLKKLPER